MKKGTGESVYCRKEIAVQGIAGCYHEEAARFYFRKYSGHAENSGFADIDIVPCDTFEELVSVVEFGRADAGIMAIENTIAGSILPNHELLCRSALKITGEIKMRISHVLAALPGTGIEDVKEVNSHPVALMQCKEFLKNLESCRIVEKEDTAASAKMIAAGNLTGHAAICGKRAAEDYGLAILAEGIETNKHNFTRFLILERAEDINGSDRNTCINKSSMVFSLPHRRGSLSAVLSVLSFYGMNLTRIQSVPMIGREWEYLFHVDVVFDGTEIYRQALNAISPLVNNLKILGEYEEGQQIM